MAIAGRGPRFSSEARSLRLMASSMPVVSSSAFLRRLIPVEAVVQHGMRAAGSSAPPPILRFLRTRRGLSTRRRLSRRRFFHAFVRGLVIDDALRDGDDGLILRRKLSRASRTPSTIAEVSFSGSMNSAIDRAV